MHTDFANLNINSVSPYFKTTTDTKGQGFPSHKQKYRVNCQGNIDQFTTHELVRFQFSTDNWFDPYQNYFELEIEMDTVNFGPYDMLCLDGPSTVLISEMIINLGGQEVERIYEHDQICKFLSDMSCLSNEQKALKWNEGYVVDTTNLQQYIVQNQPIHQQFSFTPSHTSVAHIANSGTFSNYQPVVALSSQPHPLGNQTVMGPDLQTNSEQMNYVTDIRYNYYDWNVPAGNVYNSSKSSNYDIYNSTNLVRDIRPITKYGQVLAVKDILWGTSDARQNSIWNPFDSITAGMKNYGRGDIRPASYYVPYDKYFYFVNGGVDVLPDGVFQTWNTYETPGSIVGVQSLHHTGGIYDPGYDTTSKRRNTKKLFHIPLMSSIIGHLLPESQHRLLPGKFLKQIFFEVRLNRYAFFTSGFKHGGALNSFTASSDSSQGAYLSPQQTMLPRNWTIKKFDFVMQLYQFPQQIEQQLLSQYSGGIKLHSQFYYLAHRQQFQNSQQLETNIFLNQKYKSVKSIWWWYQPNDYLNISACRKSFRISGNVTQYQGEFGNVFWPFHEVQGHSGNYIRSNVNEDDNTYFLEELYHSIGHTADQQLKCPFNHINFGINDRFYDPTVFLKNPSTLDQEDVIQINNGMCVYNEWRQGIGGGVYCINFEAIPQTGYGSLDLSVSTEPFTLRVEVDKQNYFRRDLTMMIWMFLDVEYIIKPDGVVEIMK